MSEFKTQPMNEAANTTEYPIYPPRGGPAPNPFVADFETEELFYQIMVEGSGNLVVEAKDGFVTFHPALQPGVKYPITGSKILLNGTTSYGSQAVTTTATGIWWYGGR